ncbi:MAG: cyclic nucleotide-binding domain-containing protein [Devosia sp.]|uniref:Crp/Fnr family transcriptional regulator n=1 Tax=Devosia sp. TaxID=1871048 RepID=UPI001AC1425C|nr:cyclic nucleotide-binding domain-containing protein [Devosia sp.]MBN9309138.1 cyclic nucleotide-binding domain-containing protein [Devosia sp.]MBN9314649.1 cyclic nucleotide-binding domain-containing protein [Devosia sp.]
MTSLLLLTYSAPTIELDRGEVLINQGESDGNLYVLDSGVLAVERDGVRIATIDQFDALIGEMSLLLGKPHSATVRAEGKARVRVVRDALVVLERHPLITLRLATLLCQRLDSTSALLAGLSHDPDERGVEQGLLGRLRSTLLGQRAS